MASNAEMVPFDDGIKYNRHIDYNTLGHVTACQGYYPWVEVTKAPFVTFSVRELFDLETARFRMFKPHLYLTYLRSDACQI